MLKTGNESMLASLRCPFCFGCWNCVKKKQGPFGDEIGGSLGAPHHLTSPLFLRFHQEAFMSLGLKSFLIFKKTLINRTTPLRVVILNFEPTSQPQA